MSTVYRGKILVLWQSLVVESYRSFFSHLQNLMGSDLMLVAPHSFRELGGQQVECAPFDPEHSQVRAEILHCVSPHVQIAFFNGLTKVLRKFFAEKRRKESSQPKSVFLCIAEPYSLTAFFAWFSLSLARVPKPHFVTYSAQNIYKRLPWPLAAVQRFLFRRTAAILVCGHGQEDVLRRHGYEGRIIYFPLWYDSKRFRPEDRALAERKLAKMLTLKVPGVRIGYCGSLSEEKGVIDLLKVFREAEAETSARIYFAGDGPLRDDVSTSGNNIVYVGKLSPDQVSAFMNAIDILIVPSKTTPHWKEQFGRVIIEAMACGVVVLGSDSGEIPWVIGDSGRIFPEGDLLSLKTLLRRWTKIAGTPAMALEKQKSLARAASFTDQICAKRTAEALATL